MKTIKMNEIVIFKAKISLENHQKIILNNLKLMPNHMVKKMKSFKFWNDQQAYMIGRMLIIEGFKLYGIDTNPLYWLEYNAHGKPFIEGNIHFNISHSKEYVLCVFSDEFEMGIDIEKITNQSIKNLYEVFSSCEKNKIERSSNQEDIFYKIWTRKEAVTKSLGKGLSIPFNSFSVLDDTIFFYPNNTVFIQELFIDKLYSCHLAVKNNSDQNIHDFKIIEYKPSVKYDRYS